MPANNAPRTRWSMHVLIWVLLALLVQVLGFGGGLIDLPWWGYILVALGLTHVTIASVTIFLHRHQAHRALDLHPVASHFFRFWLWFTTGTNTKEWAAIHRKHHAKVETPDDPHSPQVYGINRVLWGGALLYANEAQNNETIERYGKGTPEGWLECNVYAKHTLAGLTMLGLADILLFGFIPGGLIMLTQILWIPFWAAGVINGIGHYFGYRNADTKDSSYNIFPIGILIGGEELHNNHHAHEVSAKLSSKWYEFDIGWMYICILEFLGLAKVKRQHLAPVIGRAQAKGALTFISPHVFDVLRRDRGVIWKGLRVLARGLVKKELRDATGEYRTQLMILRDMLDRKVWSEDIRLEYVNMLQKFTETKSVFPYLARFAELFILIQADTRTKLAVTKSDTTIREEITEWLVGAQCHSIPEVSKFAQRVVRSVIPRAEQERT